jgi:hypothetical protein
MLRLGLVVLVVLSALCTIFAAVVTAAEAWQEHAQANWPEVTARVERCGLDQTSTRRRNAYYIHCRLSYSIGAERNVANIYSRNVPPADVWQYPANQIGPFEDWVERHPPGTPIVVRYNPANHRKVARVGLDMPGGGPRTPSNLKLLEAWAGGFVVLALIARLTRPRFPGQTANVSTPPSGWQ